MTVRLLLATHTQSLSLSSSGMVPAVTIRIYSSLLGTTSTADPWRLTGRQAVLARDSFRFFCRAGSPVVSVPIGVALASWESMLDMVCR